MSAINADPIFCIAPVCPKYMAVYPPTITTLALCTLCNIPLFPVKPTWAQEQHGLLQGENLKPLVQFPYKSLKDQLATMLDIPGIEDEIKQSIADLPCCEQGVYQDIFNGHICQELKCKDGTCFFYPSEEAKATGKLHIGVALGVDWYI